MVVSANAETMQTDYKPVLETYVRKVDKLVHLTVNGEEIITTVDHPFYVNGQGFVNAVDLCIGSELVDSNGTILNVDQIFRESLHDETCDVYNFKVDEWHTYFVGKSSIWVHNDQCLVTEPRKSEKHTTADGEPLTYKSNPKHTRGQEGNRPNAGIEPENSFELFEKSIVSSEKIRQRYTYDKSTDTIHRFSYTNGTEWHWSGSENQEKNSLSISDIPKDVKNTFKKEYGIKVKGR